MFNTTTPHRLRRTLLALSTVAAIGVGAGVAGASDDIPVDIPTEWPDPVRQRANQAAAYCANPAAAAAAGYNVIVGTGIINGTAANDLILASGVADTVRSGRGNDIVCAFGDDDRVRGGKGDDVILGQDGNDRLLGEQGDDILLGGPGIDVCDGGPGVDFVNC